MTNTQTNQSYIEEELLNYFLDLVKIPSPSLNERNLANYILNFCQQHHINHYEDKAGDPHQGNSGNIIARIPGNGKQTILFSAHMDTVLPCDAIHPIIKDGIIYSDGTSILGGDDKSGIAPMLMLMKEASQHPQDYPDLVFVFSIAEEIGLLGALGLAQEELVGVNAAFILDSGGAPGECVIAAPYLAGGTITIHGKEAHAGNHPEQGINALVVAAHAINQLTMGRIDEETTSNIGVVRGGLATNIVMAQVEMEFEARSLNLAKLQQVLDTTKTTFQDSCNSHLATLQFDVTINTPGYRLETNNPLVQTVQNTAKQIGLSPFTKQSGGGSDTNIYSALGVPAMTLATGMTKVHTVQESIAIQDLVATWKWIDAIAKNFAKKRQGNSRLHQTMEMG